MLKLFERNTAFQVVLTLVVTALLWGPSLVHPQSLAAPEGFAPLYQMLYNLSPSPLLSVILAIALVLAGGFLLNLMMARTGLVSQNSLMPTLLFTLSVSCQTETLSPTLIVSVLAIAIVKLLMLRSTLLTVSIDKIFGAAALIGICTMIYLPSLTLLIFYLLVAVSYRLYGWRDWMVLLLGLLAPWVLLWAVEFLQGSLSASFNAIGETFAATDLRINKTDTLTATANGFLLGLFFVSLFTLWLRLGERTVVWKKNASTLMLLTVAALAQLIHTSLFPVNLQFFAIPFALCVTLLFTPDSRRRSRSAKNWRGHIYDLLLILTIFAAVVC